LSEDPVTLLVPGPRRDPLRGRIQHRRHLSAITEAVRSLPNVSIVVPRGERVRGRSANGVSPSRRHIALILVDELDRATVKAIRYASTIEALDVRAVHAAADPVRAAALIEAWMEHGAIVQVRLDVEECFDRNIVRSLRRYVGELEDADTRVTLVLPRREYPHRLHLLLHDRTSRAIAHAFTDDEHVDVVVVP
jgi:hypothetical protein